MKKQIATVTLLMMVGIFCGCEPEATKPALKPTGPLKLTAADTDKTHIAAAGQEIIISLDANATTGYQWVPAMVEQFSSGKEVLKRGEGKYTPNESGGRVGAGGVYTQKFQALNPGKAKIIMHYTRPWEKAEKPAKTFSVIIDVR